MVEVVVRARRVVACENRVTPALFFALMGNREKSEFTNFFNNPPLFRYAALAQLFDYSNANKAFIFVYSNRLFLDRSEYE